MALLGKTQLGLAALVLTALLSLSTTGEGFRQELWMYTDEGTYLHFDSHIPDLTNFSSILPRVRRTCATGVWMIFTTENYQTSDVYLGFTHGRLECMGNRMDRIKSLRYMAAKDTSTDTISLYSGDYYSGEEIVVTANAKTDISIPIITVATTGSSRYMLYEGKNLDGKSLCYTAASLVEVNFDHVKLININLTTIGSVFKGCNVKEIQLYRELNNM